MNPVQNPSTIYPRFKFSDIEYLSEIDLPEICPQARFKFDSKILVFPNDEWELKNGQWFLIRNGLRILIEGMWKSNQ